MDNEKVIPTAPPELPDEAREIYPVKMIRYGEDTLDTTEEKIIFSDFRPAVLPANAVEEARNELPKDLFAQASVAALESPVVEEETTLDKNVLLPVEKDNGVPINDETGKQISS